MTVLMGKRQINLGWEAFAGLMLFTIATCFTIGIKTNQFIDKLNRIEANQNVQLKRDSIQQLQINQNTADDALLKPDVAALKSDVNLLKEEQVFRKYKPRYVTETKDASGRIKLHSSN